MDKPAYYIGMDSRDKTSIVITDLSGEPLDGTILPPPINKAHLHIEKMAAFLQPHLPAFALTSFQPNYRGNIPTAAIILGQNSVAYDMLGIPLVKVLVSTMKSWIWKQPVAKGYEEAKGGMKYLSTRIGDMARLYWPDQTRKTAQFMPGDIEDVGISAIAYSAARMCKLFCETTYDGEHTFNEWPEGWPQGWKIWWAIWRGKEGQKIVDRDRLADGLPAIEW